MQVDLTGQVVVITGAASGVGAASARRIAGAGAAGLMLVDRDAAGLAAMVAEIGPQARGHVADLADPDAPAQVIAATLAGFGRIDGLVNAAALTTRASFLDGGPAEWDSLMAVNARAPFFLMQGAIRAMLQQGRPKTVAQDGERATGPAGGPGAGEGAGHAIVGGATRFGEQGAGQAAGQGAGQAAGQGGAIVNILSINARCGIPELAIYSASKGALTTLTRNAANAHLADRIRVNGINLGWTLTPAEHRMQAEVLGKGEDWVTAVAAGLPLGRLLDPDEAARLVLWLLAPQSAPMTGVALDLDQNVAGS